MTSDRAIEMQENGLPNTFVPGRNLLFLTLAAALGYRRQLDVLVGGMCETDFSGYPDCRDDTIKAQQVALGLGLGSRVTIETPLMWIDKSKPGRWQSTWAATPWSRPSSRKATPVTWASAARAMTGVMAAANARPASCAELAGTNGRRRAGSEASVHPHR